MDWHIVAVAGIMACLFVGGLVAVAAWQTEQRSRPDATTVASSELSEEASSISAATAEEGVSAKPDTSEPALDPATIRRGAIQFTAWVDALRTVVRPSDKTEDLDARALAASTVASPPADGDQEPATGKRGAADRPQVSIKRRHSFTDEDLRKQLLQFPALELGAEGRRAILAPGPRNQLPVELRPHPTADLLLNRKDLAGLPVRKGFDCQLGKEPSDELQALSRSLRVHLDASIPGRNIGDLRIDAATLRDRLLGRAEWQLPEAVPALVQMLQAESKSVRLLLVELLSRISDRCATTALVQRALYDLAPEVRAAAIQSLVERPREEYRTLLLEGFRYPWAPVADHAAEALVALQDREAAPELARMARDPSSTALTASEVRDGKVLLMTREMVRINHLGNCLMCHMRSASTNDPVRGRVPTPGQPLPPATSSQYYGNDQGGIFVRADVTYLKQDFSVPQPVVSPGQWPVMQRYDYLIRSRPPTPADLKDQGTTWQRTALLHALEELDPNWKRLLIQR